MSVREKALKVQAITSKQEVVIMSKFTSVYRF